MENVVVVTSNGRRTTTTFFSFFFVFVYGFSLYYTSVDNSDNVSSSSSSPTTTTTTAESSLFLWVAVSLGFCLAALMLVVVAVRATVVTWITVLVLLAFAGKRRKSLVREGRKITTDVTMYTIKFGLKGRSLVAIAFAILSFIALLVRS